MSFHKLPQLEQTRTHPDSSPPPRSATPARTIRSSHPGSETASYVPPPPIPPPRPPCNTAPAPAASAHPASAQNSAPADTPVSPAPSAVLRRLRQQLPSKLPPVSHRRWR